MHVPHPFAATLFVVVLAACASTSDAADDGLPNLPAERRSEPIVVRGAMLRNLAGKDTARVLVFRYDRAAGWRQIPYQVDERRVTKLWNGATCPQQCEERYVFSADEGNGLDVDDEIVFMASDLGEHAPPDRPAGMESAGYRIEATLPSKEVAGYAYVFESRSVAREKFTPLVRYTRNVLEPGREDTTVATDSYRVHYSRLWVLDELAVLAGGGGDGTDLVDQWKGRAYDRSLRGETEDVVGLCGGWSNPAPHWGTHSYLGNLRGPVRAIRSVQGACSWPNLTRVDVFYAGVAEIGLNLRGHPFPPGSNGLWMYWDYEKAALPLTYFNPLVPRGTTIDGAPDPAYPNGDQPRELANASWEQVSSAHGGFAFTLRQTARIPGPVHAFFGDEASFDDGTGSDRGVFGGNGFHVLHVDDTDPATGGQAAQALLRYRPVPAGSPSLGERYLAVDAAPLVLTASEH